MTIAHRRRIEEEIAAIAVAQHGAITRAQLHAVGVSASAVDRRLRDGLIRPRHRGVYLVGPLTPPLAHEMAAVLACGATITMPGTHIRDASLNAIATRCPVLAVVSHRSATAVWGLDPPRRPGDPVQVIAIGSYHHRHPGISVRRVGMLHADDIAVYERVPVTTPARTLCDIARATSVRDLERLASRAVARGITTQAQLLAALERYAPRPGTSRLRALLGRDGEPALTRSEAEARFLALLREMGAPSPAVNTRVSGFEVDFLWRAQSLIVEVDGFAFHSSRAAFEDDRRRGTVLAAAGMNVIRITWSQIVEEPKALAYLLGQALARARK